MKSLVVLFALAAVACGSLVPLAQPPHYPAVVLDPHGRPLDTAAVINARAIHLQAKALEGHLPYAHSYAAPVVAPVYSAAYASPYAYGYGLGGHGHWLKKRSLAHVAYVAPSAVSHQSRIDVHSSPAIVSHAVAPVVHATPVVHAVPAAVSHQSRVDVRTSPVVAHSAVVAPYAHGLVAPYSHGVVAASPYSYASPYLQSSPFVHAW